MDALFQALASGATVVCANQRLARYLRVAYDAQQQRVGLRVWPSAHVLPWRGWLSQLWAVCGLDDAQLLLSTAQEQVVWERIIRDSPQGGALLQIEAAARLAREAWQLCQTWSLDICAAATPLNEDAQAYLAWSTQFTQQCEQNGWLSAGALPARLAHAILGGAFKADAYTRTEVILAGFDEITPAQEQLMQVLAEIGWQWQRWAPVSEPGVAHTVAACDAEAEVWSAARWARQWLSARQTDGDGMAHTLAVVVPDLDVRRADIERIFDSVLHPASMLPDQGSPEHHWRSRSYNLSVGRPLADYPLVHDALLLLSFDAAPQSLEHISALLRSPFMGGAESESGARARLDARLRAWGEERMTPGRLHRLLGEADVRHLPPCPRLATHLSDWLACLKTLARRQSPAAWAQVLPALLGAAGWPGERTLDSLEYQTMQAFQGVLSQLASLDVVHAGLTQAEGVRQLQRLCRAQVFQPEGSDAPIQILGVLEAAGQRFERLWLMGLHDEVWPPPPRPNPLLPIALQRQRGVPHASPARELDFTQHLMQRLCASADTLILSYPLREGERILRPSPLVEALALTPIEPEVVPCGEAAEMDYTRRLLTAGDSVVLMDSVGPALRVEEAAASGGSAIFKFQAACPFRAFAQLRLGAAVLEVPRPGLDPRARGILLHAALEALWQSLGDQAHLLGGDALAVRHCVDTAVDQALAHMVSQRPQTFTERFTQLERERLTTLLLDWLEQERQRAPFVVVHREQERTLTLGGVTARLKIDRIDRLDDASLVIIDYKSGLARVADWLGERPDAPQLPLYVLSEHDDTVGAVVFARVSTEEMGFKGLSVEPDRLPGVDTLARSRAAGAYPDWDTLLAHWRETLTRLGAAFMAGEAGVDPKHYPHTCRLCPLPVLCRVTGERDEPHERPDDAGSPCGGEDDG